MVDDRMYDKYRDSVDYWWGRWFKIYSFGNTRVGCRIIVDYNRNNYYIRRHLDANEVIKSENISFLRTIHSHNDVWKVSLLRNSFFGHMGFDFICWWNIISF